MPNNDHIERLAHLLVTYSTKVRPKDIVVVSSNSHTPKAVTDAIMQEIQRVGAFPVTALTDDDLLRQVLMKPDKRQLTLMANTRLTQLVGADAYISCTGFDNQFSHEDIPAASMKLWNDHYVHVVQDELMNHTRWVLTRYPTGAYAQLAHMSLARFTEFYFAAALCDYRRMKMAMIPLKELMLKTKRIRLVGPGTDLTLSKEGIPVVICAGEKNIPDGEIFTAPVRDSINGRITFNIPTVTHEGQYFDGVCLVFKKGKIIQATCRVGNVTRLNEYLDTDEGARYTGEFSIGTNLEITQAMCDTLFDEKIGGSIHLTPGKCYDDAPNGNKSTVHWDQVLDQRKQSGGGKLYFDGKLVRQDGLFLPKHLQGLNPVKARS